MDERRDGIPGRQYAPLKPKHKPHKIVLAQKIRSFKDARGLTFAAISNRVWDHLNAEEKTPQDEPWKEGYLRRFVNDPDDLTPTGQQMNLMYRFLDEQGAWDHRAASRDQVSQIEDVTYYALLEFFDVAEMTMTNLLRRLPGIYRIYRPVLTHPDHFVVGVVRIWSEDDHRGILFYEEYDAIQKMNGREPKHVTLKGYAFKKSNFVTLFATDSSRSSIHMTTFTSCEIQDDEYIALFGGFFDTLGKQMYSGKVLMERMRDIDHDEETFNRLKDEALCVSRSSVPPSILSFFDIPGASGDVALF